MYWNLGLDCEQLRGISGRSCTRKHSCSHDSCVIEAREDHRAIQHPPRAHFEGHRNRLQGMNSLHPDPIAFHEDSSEKGTLEACAKYNVQPPPLNADLFELLLHKTSINQALQKSLIRGWREGLELGSNIPQIDHLVESQNMEGEQLEVLRKTLKKEIDHKRLVGPLEKPIRDGRWFKNTWVSPYFVIPRKTPSNLPQRWRLIHHLSYHNSGQRSQSINGCVDLNRFPTVFPTHMTGAHLLFCLSPPGSVLFGRDIRNYYRNFILNPYC